MTLEDALVRAAGRGASVTVYNAKGVLVGAHNPQTNLAWLRLIERENPSYTFGTSDMSPGEALEHHVSPPATKA